MTNVKATAGRALRRVLGASALFGLLLGGPRSVAQDAPAYQVVVNAQNPASEIARAEVSRYFLKQSTKWPDGKIVVPLDQSSRSAVRAAFTAGIHRQPVPAIETYWQKQIFSGRTLPPFVKLGDAEVMSYVASNTSAIAYVSGSATLVAGVKAVKIKE